MDPLSRYYDEEEPDPLKPAMTLRPARPTIAASAGFIWVGFGCLSFASLPLALLLVNAAGDFRVYMGWMLCGMLTSLAGGGFIHAGRQTLKGAARDTLGNGVGSLFFALGGLGLSALAFGGSVRPLNWAEIAVASFIGICALGLLAAGLLALAGRRSYCVWRLGLQKHERRGTETLAREDFEDI
jgi:hypothetical protein